MTATATRATDLAVMKVVRAKYSLEHGDVVLGLIDMARDAGRHTQRLPAAAYRNGLIVGLSYDRMDANYPECPYDARALPNFARGDNDPRRAWRDGSRDGLRIREMVLFPNRIPVPELQYREYKMLTPELRAAHFDRNPF